MLRKISAYIAVLFLLLNNLGCGFLIGAGIGGGAGYAGYKLIKKDKKKPENVANIEGIKKRAYETRVYEAGYKEAWEAVMTFFQDINIVPSFTDKETGLIKAETANATFSAYIKSLDPSHVSVRLLAVDKKGKRIWKEKDYPLIHNKIQEIISQKWFLKGTVTPIE